MKTFTKRWGIILFILFGIIAILGSILFLITGEEGQNNIIENAQRIFTNKDNNKNPETNNNLNNPEKPTTSGSGGGSSGGGSGGSSGGESGPPPSCENTIEITYGLINYNKTEICNQNQSQICENKTVNCKIDIQNRDNSIGGIFEVELRFVEEGQSQENYIESKISQINIGPGEIKPFEESLNLQSTGQVGIANQVINCFYNTIEVPVQCI